MTCRPQVAKHVIQRSVCPVHTTGGIASIRITKVNHGNESYDELTKESSKRPDLVITAKKAKQTLSKYGANQ